MNFNTIGAYQELTALDPVAFDGLPFGAVELDEANAVVRYNTHEEKYSGLPADRVVGRHFFYEVAPCMNNYMVAERLNAQDSVDVTMPYVLTFRMRPTPVQLRLLRSPGASRRWVLIARETD